MVCWKTCFDTGMGSFCFPWRLKNQDSKNWSRCSRLAHPLRWSCLHLNFPKVWVSLAAAWVSGKFTIFCRLVQWPSSRKFFWLIKKFSSNSFACLWKTGSSPSENVNKLPSYVDTVWDAECDPLTESSSNMWFQKTSFHTFLKEGYWKFQRGGGMSKKSIKF